MRRNAALGLIVLGVLLSLMRCGKITGGSGTETVGFAGILVDSTGTPVENAFVALFSDSVSLSDPTSPLGIDTTDSSGTYLFEALKNGTYGIAATTPDSSLILRRNDIDYDSSDTSQIRSIDDQWFFDLLSDTLRPPGSLSGTAYTLDNTHGGIRVYIPGTSFDATTDDAGEFVISRIPPGLYAVRYEKLGYAILTRENIPVESNRTTILSEVRLDYDTATSPPPPHGLSARFDTLTETVELQWDSLPLGDLKEYAIYAGSDTATPTRISSTTGREFIHDISSLLDSLTDSNDSLILSYQITAIDNNNNESSFPSPVIIVAVPRSRIATAFTWELFPADSDTVTPDTSIRIAVRCENTGRSITVVHWFIDDTLTLLDSSRVSGTVIRDTLVYQPNDTGSHLIIVRARDDAGWSTQDSRMLTVDEAIDLLPHNTWDMFNSLPTPRYNAGAAILDSVLYVVGGRVQSSLFSSPSVYSQVDALLLNDSGTWTQCAPLAYPRYGGVLVSTASHLYAFGGISNTGNFTEIERYDPVSDEWSTVGTAPAVLHGTAAIAVGDSIFVFGGMEANNQVLDSIFLYSPQSDEWASIGALRTPRAYHSAVLVEGMVYILGGLARDLQSALSSVEIFDPATGGVSDGTSLPSARLNFGAAAVEGCIYVMGGSGSVRSFEILKTVEAFTPATGTWTTRSPMRSPRHSFSACVYNGIIFVAGGAGEAFTDPVPVIDRYYP